MREEKREDREREEGRTRSSERGPDCGARERPPGRGAGTRREAGKGAEPSLPAGSPVRRDVFQIKSLRPGKPPPGK